MFRSVAIVGLSILCGGCGLFPPSHLGGIATTVTPEDYGQRLCGHLDLEDYPSCLSQVLDSFEQPRANTLPPGHSTSGPFAVMMEKDVYLGHYQSDISQASFRVSNGRNGCRGSYNAFAGSPDAIYDVYCDDGRSGWADIIRDSDGRNGIGKLALDDGTQGEIVFGYVPLGQADPYPYAP
ncbi:hypothetical protein CCR95_03075 [Thiocystis minor]|uniref:hypothetical protein n=1 Tax=Thiocystis minor TaxID=61597 RepID=UPI001913B914|nr:hypothetical protein [Thiocystis minor]MBK5963098.1 hypothetical protein [Thiocystis minor]